jgi:hypothetical protein
MGVTQTLARKAAVGGVDDLLAARSAMGFGYFRHGVFRK